MIAELEAENEIQEMAERNEKLIYYVLNKFGLHDQIDEFYGACAEGLLEGCKKYNSQLGVTEASYLFLCIKHSISMELTKKRAKKRTAEFIYLDQEIINERGQTINLYELISSDFNLQNHIEQKEIKNILRKNVFLLDDLNKKIICHYFGVFGYEKMSQQELAKLFETTQMTISRRIKRSLEKLRRKIYGQLYL